jgi:hypothetical protein
MTVIACGSSRAASTRSASPATSAKRSSRSASSRPSATRAHRCGPPHAKTLAADRVARIYSRGGEVYGCAAGARRSYLLGSSSRSIRQGRVGPAALAGRIAAYGLTSYGVDTVSASVVVRSLRDGKQLHTDPGTSRPVGAEFLESVDRVVLKRDGSVAWTSTAGSIVSGHRSEIEVNRDDLRGRTLLDSGAGIAPDSLRLHGSQLSWRDGAATRYGTLR